MLLCMNHKLARIPHELMVFGLLLCCGCTKNVAKCYAVVIAGRIFVLLLLPNAFVMLQTLGFFRNSELWCSLAMFTVPLAESQ